MTRAGPARAPAGVVMLHGLFGRGADWDPVLAAMGDNLAGVRTPETWAPDLPGHAATPLGAAPLSLDGWAEWLASGIAERFAGPVAVVGYSLGGRLALRLAALRPDLVARLALVGAHPGIEDAGERAARARLDEVRSRELEDDPEAFFRAWYGAPLFDLEGAALEVAVAERTRGDVEAMARVLAALSPGRQPSSRDVLSALGARMLFVAGERDAKYGAVGEDVVARAGAGARLVAIPNAGHGVLRDAPEALSDVLTEWLSGDVAPTG